MTSSTGSLTEECFGLFEKLRNRKLKFLVVEHVETTEE